jgi:hypothetical protein
VRFQTTETVQTPDSEIVLRVLETTLPEISSDVVREGPQITLRGLGPSPRSRNPRDITILHVSSDHATTVIHVDVNFQASALLGTVSQDSVVRSKLDYVFDQVRTQLSLETRRAEGSDLVPHSGVLASAIDAGVAEMPRAPVEAVERLEQGFVAKFSRTTTPEPPVTKSPEPPVTESSEPSVLPAETPVHAVSAPSEPVGIQHVAEVVAAPEPPRSAPAAEVVPVVSELPVEAATEQLTAVASVRPAPVPDAEAATQGVAPAKPRAERPMLQFSSSRAQRTHVPALIMAIIALLLLFAVAAYYLLRPNPPESTPTSFPAQTRPVDHGSLFRAALSRAHKISSLQVRLRFR